MRIRYDAGNRAVTVELSIVVPGSLAVGPGLSDPQLEQLIEQGVTAVLSLQEQHEAPEPSAALRERLVWARVPLADGHQGGELNPPQLEQAVDQLRQWRAAGHMIYVHCYAGVGRSPAVCAAYLAATERLSLGEALARVRSARPVTNLTAQQLLVLADYVARLRRLGEVPSARPGKQ